MPRKTLWKSTQQNTLLNRPVNLETSAIPGAPANHRFSIPISLLPAIKIENEDDDRFDTEEIRARAGRSPSS